MRKTTIGISLLVCLFLFGANRASAAEYYIDGTNGSDSQAGSQTAPWRTLAKVSSLSIVGGDTVYLKGTFAPTDILTLDADIQGSEASHPTTIQNWAGESAILIIDGSGVDKIHVNGDYFTLNGLTLNNNGTYLSMSTGIDIVSSSTNIIITGCTFNDAYEAIAVGIGATNITIKQNIFTNNYYGVSLTSGSASNLSIYNNLFYANTAVGIGGNSATNLLIYNNTFSGAQAGVYVASCTGQIKNNIFTAHTAEAIGLDEATGMISDYNLFYANTAVGFLMLAGTTQTSLVDWQAVGQDVHSISSDPLFVSASDYHLQSTSPAIDAGTDLATSFTTDYDSDVRPQGVEFDMGYDEYYVEDLGDDNPVYTPDQVTGVKIPTGYLKAKQAKVKWTAVTNATGYNIMLYKYSKKQDKYIEYKTYKLSEASTQKTIKKLSAQSRYKVRVRAKRIVDAVTYKGDWSSWVKFITKKS